MRFQRVNPFRYARAAFGSLRRAISSSFPTRAATNRVRAKLGIDATIPVDEKGRLRRSKARQECFAMSATGRLSFDYWSDDENVQARFSRITVL